MSMPRNECMLMCRRFRHRQRQRVTVVRYSSNLASEAMPTLSSVCFSIVHTSHLHVVHARSYDWQEKLWRRRVRSLLLRIEADGFSRISVSICIKIVHERKFICT